MHEGLWSIKKYVTCQLANSHFYCKIRTLLDTCAPEWKTIRDYLIVAAFALSFVTLIPVGVISLLLMICTKGTYTPNEV